MLKMQEGEELSKGTESKKARRNGAMITGEGIPPSWGRDSSLIVVWRERGEDRCRYQLADGRGRIKNSNMIVL